MGTRNFITRLTALAAVAGVAMPVLAADLDPVVFTDDANYVSPAELGSGWYIRGDIGVNLNGKHDVTSTSADMQYRNNNITDRLTYSVGFGKQINKHLRAEVNVGRLQGANWDSTRLLSVAEITAAIGSTTDPNPCNGWREYIDIATGTVYRGDGTILNCIEKDRVEYDSTFVMANAYVDLGTYYGFTPFVGGGIGLGRVGWTQEVNQIECVPVEESVVPEGCRAYGVADQPAPNAPYTQPGDLSSGTGYRLGWELGAGFAYDVSSNTKLEASYKYKNFGASSLKYSANTPTGEQLARNGFGVHQVNVGFRYSFF